MSITEASQYLRALAAAMAAAYVAEAQPRAILLAGSAAEGLSDHYSDLDIVAYYDRLPTDDQLAAAYDRLGVDARTRAPRSADAVVEKYTLRGVECEVLHTTIAEWERQMAIVLEQHAPRSLAQKALIGLLSGLALHGHDLIEQWQARAAAYPEGLAQTMVEQYLKFLPPWQMQERVAARGAALWYQQILVETSHQILGVLAGLNRRYYSTTQFKHLRRFVASMPYAPEDLATRIESLFVLSPTAAAEEAERLVGETVTLVEAHMPEIDTTVVRHSLGARQTRWTLDVSR